MYDIFYSAMIITISLIIVYNNINIYKFKIIDFIYISISIFSSYIILGIFNEFLATFFAYTIPIIYIYKKANNLFQSITFNSFCIFITIIIKSFLELIFMTFFNISISTYSLKFYIFYLINFLVEYILSKLISTVFSNYFNKIISNYKLKYILILYTVIIVTSIMFFTNINWNEPDNIIYLSQINCIFFIIYSSILFISCIILFLSFKKEIKLKAYQTEMKNLEEYTNSMENLFIEMKKFRYDYLNIISSIEILIKENNMNELKEYFSKNIYTLNVKINNDNNKIGLIRNIKLLELKGLMASKLIKAQKLGIDINIEILDPITNINMDKVDLIRCVGILLDNAIEAAVESTEKKVNIGLIKKENSIIILVINSFKNNIPNIYMLFKEGYSTKGENRGLGLSTLKSIVRKYKNIILDTSINNNEFTQILNISNDISS